MTTTPTTPTHFTSASCSGEFCHLCNEPATHKVGEEIPHDDPLPNRHNFTAYVCCTCFARIFGEYASKASLCDPLDTVSEEKLIAKALASYNGDERVYLSVVDPETSGSHWYARLTEIVESDGGGVSEFDHRELRGGRGSSFREALLWLLKSK